MKTAKEIAKEIFYSPATNGKAEESILNGEKLIEEYAKGYKKFMCAKGAEDRCKEQCFTCSEDEACDFKNLNKAHVIKSLCLCQVSREIQEINNRPICTRCNRPIF